MREAKQPDRTKRVVVAGDDVIDSFGRAVRVDDRDDRDAEPIRFRDGDLFFADVDDKEHVRQTAHFLDAREVLHQACRVRDRA